MAISRGVLPVLVMAALRSMFGSCISRRATDLLLCFTAATSGVAPIALLPCSVDLDAELGDHTTNGRQNEKNTTFLDDRNTVKN